VRLRPEAFDRGRPHLLKHARLRHVGVVGGPTKQSPDMARLYVIVRFDGCPHDHRLLEHELEVVDR
jgi:hypothetical protein